jgi:hypothetical protein
MNMRDGIDFARDVARFTESEAAYIVDVLRGAYKIVVADGNEAELLGDFISALEDCDCINIVDDVLVDEA